MQCERTLTDAQVAQFREQGWPAPFRAIDAARGSKPNRSAAPRIGFAFFYIPTHVRSTTGRRSATLVRGVNRYGYWDPDPLPQFDFDPVAFAAMRAAWGKYRDGEVKQAADA